MCVCVCVCVCVLSVGIHEYIGVCRHVRNLKLQINNDKNQIKIEEKKIIIDSCLLFSILFNFVPCMAPIF